MNGVNIMCVIYMCHWFGYGLWMRAKLAKIITNVRCFQTYEMWFRIFKKPLKRQTSYLSVSILNQLSKLIRVEFDIMIFLWNHDKNNLLYIFSIHFTRNEYIICIKSEYNLNHFHHPNQSIVVLVHIYYILNLIIKPYFLIVFHSRWDVAFFL